MLEFPPLSFPPRKRGPRSRGVAVVTERTSAQRSIPPAGCLGAHEKTAPSVLRRLWWFDVLLVAVQSSVVPGSRRSPGKRGEQSARPRGRGVAAVTERISAQRVFGRHDAWVPAPFVAPAKAGA